MKYDILIQNGILLSDENDFQPFRADIGVKDGRIALISEAAVRSASDAAGCIDASEYTDAFEYIDASDRIVMPGLFNLHCHGDMTLARGMGDDMTLAEQNAAFEKSSWLYRYISDADRYASRQLTYAEALLSGTTFILENMYWGLGTDSAKAMEEMGIDGALAEDVRPDYMHPQVLHRPEYLKELKHNAEEHGLRLLAGSISEEDFSPELLGRIRRLTQEAGLRQTCHLAETDWRLRLIRERYGKGPIEMLYEAGVLNGDMLASHVVHPTEREIGLLAQSGCHVVNTPLCEMKIADGAAPIADMVRCGVNVCLGTDGAMWNNSNDIFREMKGMMLLQTLKNGIRSLKLRDVLRMATVNGARAMGLEAETGSIAVGKRADLILVNTAAPHMQPLRTGSRENAASCVVFNACGRDVTDVFVKGRQVVRQGRLLTADVNALAARVRRCSETAAEALDRE